MFLLSEKKKLVLSAVDIHFHNSLGDVPCVLDLICGMQPFDTLQFLLPFEHIEPEHASERKETGFTLTVMNLVYQSAMSIRQF